MTITLKDTPATKLDQLVERAQNRRHPGDMPPFTVVEVRKILEQLGLFQEEENARTLFAGLAKSL